jgi:uncharacterized phage protein (TIGR01671 family)
MSRVIKFRAWDGKEMINEAIKINFEPAHIYKGCAFPDSCTYSLMMNGAQSVMQFTGLLDANGVEIYESDVIKGLLVDKRGERFEFTGSVFYQEYEFCIETDLHSWPVAAWHCVEKPAVIGNIYQNPELLK